MDSRITMHRRRFAEVISQKPHMTFHDLKKNFIKKDGMNLATLYRIIDAFKDQGLIHEIALAGERTFFLCQSLDTAEQDKGVIVTACTNCKTLTDNHFSLETPVIESQTTQFVKSCQHCLIQ